MWRCRAIAPASSRGLSLIELMIVLSMWGLFMGAVYEAVILGLRLMNASNSREAIRVQLAKTLDQLTREAGSRADHIDVTQDARFQFDTPGSMNNVNYVYTSGAGGTGTLTRRDSTMSAATTILQHLSSFDFDYAEQGATTTTASPNEDDVRVVHVTATVTKNNETISASSAAFLRSCDSIAGANC